MTVRKKIAILITAAGFISGLCFSIVLLWYMWEEPLSIVDSELDTVAKLTAYVISKKGALNEAPFLDEGLYWLKIYDSTTGELIYKSRLTDTIDLPRPEDPESPLTVALILPIEKIRINLGQDKKGEVNFRVKSSDITFGDKKFFAISGRPVENIEEHLIEIVTGIGIGFIASFVLLIGVSYFVAGFILKPIRSINDQIIEITERHLDRRIPVSENSMDEFSVLARTLNQIFDRLEHAFLRQKRLIADTSHELKTPLTMMKVTLNELINLQDSKDLPPLYCELVAKFSEYLIRMEKLVKDLLDLSSLELATNLGSNRVNLSELVKSLLEDYRLLLDSRNISAEIHIGSDLIVIGDEQQLYRALSNVIDNSIKYNVDGGKLEIAVIGSMNHISVIIGNSGPGIPKDEIPKVFDQFYRVEKSRSSKYGGSGLGLSIAKRIIELHGGAIRIDSEEGKWTEVTILLPRFRKKES